MATKIICFTRVWRIWNSLHLSTIIKCTIFSAFHYVMYQNLTDRQFSIWINHNELFGSKLRDAHTVCRSSPNWTTDPWQVQQFTRVPTVPNDFIASVLIIFIVKYLILHYLQCLLICNPLMSFTRVWLMQKSRPVSITMNSLGPKSGTPTLSTWRSSTNWTEGSWLHTSTRPSTVRKDRYDIAH